MRGADTRPRFLFVNENIGGHRTVHGAFRRIFADRDDIEVEFLDGGEPGLLGKLLRAPLPGLARFDLDLQPLRGQLVQSWMMRRRVRERLDAGGIDAMHVYTQNTMLGGAGLLRSVPTVITTDSTGRLNVFSIPYRKPTRFTGPMSRVNPFFERPVLQAAVKVFATSQKVAKSLCSADYRIAPQKVAHLEKGVHSPYLTEPVPVRDPGRRPGIVFIGTTLERKGGRLLLDVWRDELKDRADLTLITLEEVPTEPGLTVINDLAPGDGRIWDILAGVDILCFPSVIDQAPNAILEAMVAGLPVIAHPNGAIPEMVVDGETGFLVDCRQREEVARVLLMLVDDAGLRQRMGEAGHRHVCQRYNMVDTASVIVNELLAAAGHHRTTATGGSGARAGHRPGSASFPRGGRGDSGITRFRIHDTVDQELEAQWEDLAQRYSTRFSSRPSYGLSWFRALGKGDLAVATVHRRNRLVALLPLHTRARAGITVHRLLGHGRGTVGEALAQDATSQDELVAGLHDAGVVLELTHLPEDSPVTTALLDHGGWTVEYETDEHCPVIDLPPGSTPHDIRSGKTLRRFRVARERIGEQFGPVGFVVVRTPGELRAAWPEMVRVARVSSEADPEGRVNLLGDDHADFAERFLTREAEGGHLLVVGLTVDSTWVALNITFQTGERVEGWFTRFDPAYGKLLPGHQMLEHLVGLHDDMGFTVVDEMIGRGAYKQDWQTSEYRVGTVVAAPVARAPAIPLVRSINGTTDALRRGIGWIRPHVPVAARPGEGR
ncbi:GNAT family N-acetyltransferase [Corynebacterium comes]|uniref:Capsular glucan synthase n=1 Tax=Corynebacterium comes TaxID=2675218 RepID=A0A6B8VZR8_9CORY|nr:GNAT family N-acetyltransferase [Corynebacterium comes]QGU05711.1 Capsular glucan synthase [Corynebacterium comes]